MKKYLILTLCAASIGLHGCASLDPVSAVSAGAKLYQAATLSDAYVQQLVTQYVAELDKQNDVAGPNDPYTQRINRVTSAFNNEAGINIKVYKTKEANAFATADGSVRVYTGLMDIMTDDELLGVIGHEIGHYINHDTKDAFRNALLTSAFRDALTSTGGAVAVLSSSQLGDLAETLSQSQYSQKQEREADSYGYEFLKNHGVNPWAMAMAFERLLELENQAGAARTPGLQQLFSTHPDLQARIKTMSERAAKDGFVRPTK